MQPIIANYNKLILSHAALLLESDTALNPMQLNAVRLIDKYAQELSQSLQDNAALNENDMRRFMRHDMLNLITPILGYGEMLSDAWMGKLNPDQSAHIEIILNAVYDIQELIESNNPALAS
jgi:signal transduction histidine kinase